MTRRRPSLKDLPPTARYSAGPTLGEALQAKGVGTEKVAARARPKSAKRAGMNTTERQFSEELEGWKAAGRILWWRFEAFKVRVTDGFDGKHHAVWYCPDFLTLRPDGFFDVYEIKGFADEKDILRLRCAADVFPADFYVVTKRRVKDGGGWAVERL